MTHRIVVGYDGSTMADAALDRAIALARSDDDWEITVVCGEDRPPGWAGSSYRFGIPIGGEQMVERWREQVDEDMEKAVSRVRAAGVTAAAACTRDEPVELILKVAHEIGAEYIVIGASGAGGVVDVILGSTAMRLLHRSDVPILIVPSQES